MLPLKTLTPKAPLQKYNTTLSSWPHFKKEIFKSSPSTTKQVETVVCFLDYSLWTDNKKVWIFF